MKNTFFSLLFASALFFVSVRSCAQTYNVCSGDSVTLNLPSYTGSLQWQQSADSIIWSDIPGATYQPYHIIGTVNKYFRAMVINGSCDPVYSGAKKIIIIPSPAITTQPDDQALCAGTGTGFAVTATGTGLTYQWQVSIDDGVTFNNITSIGSNPAYYNWTTPTLSLTSTVGGNNGYKYRCVVIGTCAPTAISNGATLTVNTVPTGVTASASPNPICPGQTLTLIGGAIGATTWSWTGPNSFISTSQSPAITNITVAAAGIYTLTASNSCGSATAVNTASVTVNPLPSTPTATAASNITQTSFFANWNIANGATTYYLDVSANSGFSSFVTGYNNLNVGNATTYSVTNLSLTTTYYYRVRAVSSCGVSANSNIITVTTIAFAIGQNYGGGIIFYIDGTNQHGLISSTSDQSTSAEWGCYGTTISGADGTAVGTGNQNTIDIEAGCTTVGIAADICANLVLNGYSDWFLPSKDELNLMYINRVAIGGFADFDYWSSSEYDANRTWNQFFDYGGQGNGIKYWGSHMRCVRSF